MRIVCVANMRPQKDHFTLVRAMEIVVRQLPGAHLLLLGSSTSSNYEQQVRQEADRLGLAGSVSFMGERSDVPAVLGAVDVGVLSSASEGLPLVLLEYGMAGLGTVASRVGQCPEVLDDGRAGILVPSGDRKQLADAILSLLNSPERRTDLGSRLRKRVIALYSQDSIVQQVCEVYNVILERARGQFNRKALWSA
jgi:glycosyltransferase involved in cell wall biosynthesis